MQKTHLLTPEQVSLWWTVLINHHPMRDFKIIVFFLFSPQWETFSAHSNQAEICFSDIWALLRKFLHRPVLEPCCHSRNQAQEAAQQPHCTDSGNIHGTSQLPAALGPSGGPSVWARSMAACDLQHRRQEGRWKGSGKLRGPPKWSVGSAVLHVVWQGTVANSSTHLCWLRDAFD